MFFVEPVFLRPMIMSTTIVMSTSRESQGCNRNENNRSGDHGLSFTESEWTDKTSGVVTSGNLCRRKITSRAGLRFSFIIIFCTPVNNNIFRLSLAEVCQQVPDTGCFYFFVTEGFDKYFSHEKSFIYRFREGPPGVVLCKSEFITGRNPVVSARNDVACGGRCSLEIVSGVGGRFTDFVDLNTGKVFIQDIVDHSVQGKVFHDLP